MPEETSPVDLAERRLAEAEETLSRARSGVQDAVDQWDGTQRDRRWLDQLALSPTIEPDDKGVLTNLHRPTDKRMVAYKIAVAAERQAEEAREKAREHLTVERRAAWMAGGRSKLADAIHANEIAATAVEAARSAVARVGVRVEALRDQLQGARDGVASAKANQTAKMVEAAATGAELGLDTSLRKARAHEVDIADELENAEAALATVEAASAAPERQYRLSDKAVDDAVRAIALAEIPMARERVMERERERLREVSILNFLQRFYDLNDCDHAARRELEAFVERHSSIADVKQQITLIDTAVKPWQDAMAILKRDANAKLPEIN